MLSFHFMSPYCSPFSSKYLERSGRAKGNLSFSKHFLIQNNVFCPLFPVPHSSSLVEGCRGLVTGTDTASPSSTAKPTRRWTSPHVLSTFSLFATERTTEVDIDAERLIGLFLSQRHCFSSFTCFFLLKLAELLSVHFP